jgi:putative transcriptional regulator
MKTGHKIESGVKEAISYAKGTPVSRVRLTPYSVPHNIDVKKLREGLGMSQPEFALLFGFNLATLRQWEQGRRYPDGPARVLLTVIGHNPVAVRKALEDIPERRVAVG